jgi:hypothetical protein
MYRVYRLRKGRKSWLKANWKLSFYSLCWNRSPFLSQTKWIWISESIGGWVDCFSSPFTAVATSVGSVPGLDYWGISILCSIFAGEREDCFNFWAQISIKLAKMRLITDFWSLTGYKSFLNLSILARKVKKYDLFWVRFFSQSRGVAWPGIEFKSSKKTYNRG